MFAEYDKFEWIYIQSIILATIDDLPSVIKLRFHNINQRYARSMPILQGILNQMALRRIILITMNKKNEAVNKYFNTPIFCYIFQPIVDERSCADLYNYFLVQVWELSYQGKLTSKLIAITKGGLHYLQCLPILAQSSQGIYFRLQSRAAPN